MVEVEDGGTQTGRDDDAERVSTLGYFVADGVHNDRWMIAVATHQALHVVGRKAVEVEMIILLVLRAVPYVESFVDDEHALSVAFVHQRFGHRVMAAADGVETCLLEQFHFALFCTVVGTGSQQTVVVMHTGTAQQRLATIEQKTIVG